jgi:hypothetical protein
MNKEIDPILLLRDYTMHKKKIRQSEQELIFGNIKLPLDTPTAWKPKTSNKQYTLGRIFLILK